MDEERNEAVTRETGDGEQGTTEAAGGCVGGNAPGSAASDYSPAGSAAGSGMSVPAGAAAADASGGAEALREELNRARERVTQLERERVLLSQGVPEEDLDYYAFKIGKLAGGEKDFETAAKEFLKEHAAQRRGGLPRSTGASLSARAARTQSTNDTMNKLLRGA